MSVHFQIKSRKRIGVIFLLLSIMLIVTGYAGHNPPGPGTATSIGSWADPNGTLKQVQNKPFQPFNGTDNASNHTITFDVLGIETAQPPQGVVFNVSTTGSLTIKFIGAKPKVFCASCISSYSGLRELITYSGSMTDVLTVVWSGAIGVAEPQTVLFIDNFLYTTPYLQSAWTIDLYNSPSTNPGESTSGSGYLYMLAKSTSTSEAVHVTNAMFNPALYSTGTIVKRKMTVAMIPFYKTESPSTALVRTGMSPLLTSGAYPGSTPFNTPSIDAGGTCTGVNPIGSDYIQFTNAGEVDVATCGDGGNDFAFLEGGLSPALYTVVTIETYGIFCSTCTDNALVGSQWVFFRVYQENANNQIISGTDKNLNITANIAPLFQTTYAFVAQTNSNGAATAQTSRITFVQVQNYGSPVCLIAPAGALCTRLPVVPNSIIGNQGIVGMMAWLSNQIGFGDEQTGAILLFMMLSFAMGFVPWWYTKNVSVGAFGEELVLGFFTYVGFLPVWTLIIVFLGGAAVVVMIVMKFLGGGNMMGGGGSIE